MPLTQSPTRRAPFVRWLALSLALGGSCAMAEQTADVAALESAAQRGEAAAQVKLAGMYEYGNGVTQDFVKSNELYCKAAKHGDTDALLRMGLVYSYGRVVEPDLGVSALFVIRAAELGNEEAKKLVEHVSRHNGSVMPACMRETVVAAAESSSAPAARKDIAQLVQRWAPEYAVDPDLVLALITAESNFNVHAVSPKSAQGLMQLIPATAERFGVKNVFNPIENLKGGLAYLRWLLAYFKGDVALVLAAYNAGEVAVEKYRGIPPYRETRNYVRQITSVYRKASHPYHAELVAPSAALSRIVRAN